MPASLVYFVRRIFFKGWCHKLPEKGKACCPYFTMQLDIDCHCIVHCALCIVCFVNPFQPVINNSLPIFQLFTVYDNCITFSSRTPNVLQTLAPQIISKVKYLPVLPYFGVVPTVWVEFSTVYTEREEYHIWKLYIKIFLSQRGCLL